MYVCTLCAYDLNFGTCADSVYQALLSPHKREPGFEANVGVSEVMWSVLCVFLVLGEHDQLFHVVCDSYAWKITCRLCMHLLTKELRLKDDERHKSFKELRYPTLAR